MPAPVPWVIHWVLDYTGGAGKSTFCRYMQATRPSEVLCIQNGKTADIAHAWSGERIVLWDIPRDSSDKVNFAAMEAIKNGQVFSGKYQSSQKLHEIPHVVVFSNSLPPTDPKKGLSRGRIVPHLLNSMEEIPLEDQSHCRDFGFI